MATFAWLVGELDSTLSLGVGVGGDLREFRVRYRRPDRMMARCFWTLQSLAAAVSNTGVLVLSLAGEMRLILPKFCNNGGVVVSFSCTFGASRDEDEDDEDVGGSVLLALEISFGVNLASLLVPMEWLVDDNDGERTATKASVAVTFCRCCETSRNFVITILTLGAALSLGESESESLDQDEMTVQVVRKELSSCVRT